MDESDRDFAEELIKTYGEDRFYHSCKRTRDSSSARILHSELNSCSPEDSKIYLASIGIGRLSARVGAEEETPRETMCRITYGLTRHFKEFALKTHRPPASIHARMVLGDTNDWVRMYSRLLETFPDWN